MCAWPKGKPRGPRKKVEYDLESLLDNTNVIENSSQSSEDEAESDIILIDTEGVYGLRAYKYGYELHVRRKYKKDTVVESKIPASGEVRQIVYRAGEFGPWQLSAKPFHGRLDTLFAAVHQMMLKDKISEELSVKNLQQMILESEKRIIKAVTA